MTNYQLQECLGEGGFGQVFAAWDVQLMRKVAIKRLKNDASGNSTQQLLREARLAASLQHAAFVKIHALDEDPQQPAIVMELIHGKNLRDWLQLTQASIAQALSIVRQIAEAMHEAHQSGLIHGDLKPSNFMLEESGRLRILDFGLASHADPQATVSLKQADPQGTIAYLAPECLTGSAPSSASDIYALGVVMYELLHQARPFPHLSGIPLASALMQSTSAQWPYRSDLPAALVQLIRKMTASDKQQRLASMLALQQELDALASTSLSSPQAPNLPITLPITSLSPVKRLHWPLTKLKSWKFGAIGACMFAALVATYWLAPRSLPSFVRHDSAALMHSALQALRETDKPHSLELAERNFTQILQHDAENAAAIAGLSLTYSFRYLSDKQDETWAKKAAASAQQALQMNDVLALSHIAQARVLLQQGQTAAALPQLEKALQLEPDNVFAWNAKIDAYKRMRRHDEAMQLAQQAQQRYPNVRAFSDYIGLLYYEKADYPAAEKAFRHSIALEPDSVYPYANLNASLLRQNRSDEALQVLQQGLQVRPSAWLYGNLGNALFQRGDYLGAVHAFELAVAPDKGNPDDYQGWANLADTLLWIPGRAEQARQAYVQAKNLLEPRLARNPTDPTLLSRMGLYLARTGKIAESESNIKQALALADNSADVHFRAALAFELNGKRDLALREIKRALTLGYPRQFINAEPDLAALRRDKAYPANANEALKAS